MVMKYHADRVVKAPHPQWADWTEYHGTVFDDETFFCWSINKKEGKAILEINGPVVMELEGVKAVKKRGENLVVVSAKGYEIFRITF